MTSSMTAFARVQQQHESGIICWEIKSVNHRYLEASFRLPEEFRGLEIQFRSIMREQVSRGKLDCQLKFQAIGLNHQQLAIDNALVDALLTAGQKIAEEKLVSNDLTVSKLLTWPGVIQIQQTDFELISQQIVSSFKDALNQLVEARMTEGSALRQHILARLQQMKAEVEAARQLIIPQSLAARDKLMARVDNLQLSVMEGRLEQEIAILLTRLDVQEELDRLQTHLSEVEKILLHDKTIGRRLDFLMQELNREANTLSAKSDCVALTQHAVEMKVLIEQMREQIQNIE